MPPTEKWLQSGYDREIGAKEAYRREKSIGMQLRDRTSASRDCPFFLLLHTRSTVHRLLAFLNGIPPVQHQLATIHTGLPEPSNARILARSEGQANDLPRRDVDGEAPLRAARVEPDGARVVGYASKPLHPNPRSLCVQHAVMLGRRQLLLPVGDN